MTATELKHQAHLQEWAAAIQECRSSGLPVKQWCSQRGITATTYYRWEREVLATASESREPAVTMPFVELAATHRTEQKCCNIAEPSATLRIGNGCIEFHQQLTPEQLKTLVEALSSC